MNSGFGDRIPESELIITPKGTVYHLDIAPEHLAETVITVGDPDRVKEVSKYFDSIVHKSQHREFVVHSGYISRKPITVLSSGIGPDNIDIVINELDALANINFKSRTIHPEKRSLSIIRMGTCGSLQSSIPVDSLVVSTYGIGLDNLMLYYKFSNNPDERFLLNAFNLHTGLSAGNVQPYIAESAISLRNHFVAGYVQGMTITCPGFYGPQGRVLRAPLAFPNLLDSLSSFRSNDNFIANFEMETSAIYGLGKVLGHKCLSINTVVANRCNKTFSANSATAIDLMIRKSLEIIATIG